jgi:hypothetical protein
MIDKEIEALAKAVVKAAMKPDAALADMTEALKTLAAYHAILLKYKAKEDPDGDEPSFTDFTKQLEEVKNGSPKVRGRRGTGIPS